MNKKSLMFFAGFLLSIILVSMLVSAASTNMFQPLSDLVESVYHAIEPGVEVILGNSPSGENLFAKFLFFIIIFAVVWAVLQTVDFFKDNAWVLWVVSIAVSILAVRFIGSAALVQTLILPYTTLGIVLSAGLPFVIFFFVVEKGVTGTETGKRTLRRIAWLFFAVVFIGLWLARIDVLTANGNSTAGLIYPITAALAIVVMILDGTIQGFFSDMETDRKTRSRSQELETELVRKIGDADTDLSKGYIAPAERDKRVKEYQKRIAQLHR